MSDSPGELVSVARRGRDFAGEVGVLLFDAFAEREPHEAGDLDRGADAFGFLQRLRHALFAVRRK